MTLGSSVFRVVRGPLTGKNNLEEIFMPFTSWSPSNRYLRTLMDSRPAVPRQSVDGEDSIFLPKSNRRDWHHQKQPEWRQHRLNSLPLPHGHGSFRPSFSSSSLSLCTMRMPRLTLVSDGKPRRRLLIGSKKGIFKSSVAHDRAPSQQFVLEVKNDSPRP